MVLTGAGRCCVTSTAADGRDRPAGDRCRRPVDLRGARLRMALENMDKLSTVFTNE